MTTIIIWLVAFLAVQSQQMKGVADACAAALPADVVSTLRSEFEHWTVVNIQDLTTDDQELWLQLHPNACPGVAVGSFGDRPAFRYALVLLRRRGDRLEQMFVAVKTSDGAAYKTHVFGSPSQVAIPSVVIRHPPGLYYNSDRTRKVRTTADSIVFAQLEDGAIMYYWEGGRFRSLMTAQ